MTYKGVNFEDIDINRKNRLSINVKDKCDIVNGLLISKEQNGVTIETKKGEQQTFSKNEIVKMWKVKGFCFVGCVKVYK
tara:strand:- start:727 stop:963 length:237 start_codon:yes stop_codon:yes gene_type:complete